MAYSLAIFGSRVKNSLVSFYGLEPLYQSISAFILTNSHSPTLAAPIEGVQNLKTAVAEAGVNVADIYFVRGNQVRGKQNLEPRPAVYVVYPSKDSELMTASLRNILQREKDSNRRFVVIVPDQEDIQNIDDEQFLQNWGATNVIEDQTEVAAFNELENQKHQEFLAFQQRELEEKERIRYWQSWRWVTYPEFSGSIIALGVGINCLIFFIDPALLAASATAPIIIGWLLTLSTILFMASPVVGPALALFFDYVDFCERMPEPGPLDPPALQDSWERYFDALPSRLYNWHVDHKLQAAFFYGGLIGSIVAAFTMFVLGFDAPLFEFIGSAIASSFQSVGFFMADPLLAKSAEHVFAAMVFSLAPFMLGMFARYSVALVEDKILPPRNDHEIAEVTLSDDGLYAEVRFYDGLHGDIRLEPLPLPPEENIEANALPNDENVLVDASSINENVTTNTATAYTKVFLGENNNIYAVKGDKTEHCANNNEEFYQQIKAMPGAKIW